MNEGLQQHTAVSGKARIGVHDPVTNKTEWLVEKANMITDYGLESYAYLTTSLGWRDLVVRGQVTEETMVTREAVVGTYSQSGTTVTRATGSRPFDTSRYADKVVALTPVSYFPFEETAPGTLADVSGNSRNGTIYGSAFDKSFLLPGWTNIGTPSRASRFFNTDSFINYGRPAAMEFDMDVDPFSVSFFFRIINQADNTGRILLRKMGNSDTGTSFGTVGQFQIALCRYSSDPTNYQGLWVRTGGAAVRYGQNTIPFDGEWHHIVVSSNGPTSSVYFDGALLGTQANGTSQEPNVDWISLKQLTSGLNNNTGATSGNGQATASVPLSLGHLAFFNYALSHAQVKSLGDLTDGDRGKMIKWSTGEEAKILSVTSATVCEVDRSQTVAAANINLHHVGLHMMQVPVACPSPSAFTLDDGRPSNGILWDYVTGVFNNRRTYDGPIETVAKTYRTFGCTAASSWVGRGCAILIDASATPISVGVGKQVRFTYDMDFTFPGVTAAQAATPVTSGVFSGWPEIYNISGIVNNGSSFTVTTTAAHHFVATGTRKINVAGSSAHFNGEWTIGSVTSTTVVINSAVVGANAGAGGTLYNNVKRSFRAIGSPILQTGTTTADGILNNSASTANAPAKGDELAFYNLPTQPPLFNLENNINPTIPAIGANGVMFWAASGTSYVFNSGSSTTIPIGYVLAQSVTAVLAAPYAPGSFYVDWVGTFSAAQAAGTAIRRLHVIGQGGHIQYYWLFEEPQLKRNTHTITVSLRKSWGRTLPATPP